MKKRLRKKLRLGEFTDYGAWVLLRLREGVSEARRDEICDGYLDSIQDMGMRGSIGGRPDLKAMFLMNWRRSVVHGWMVDFVREWASGVEEVESFEVSDPVDAIRGGWPGSWPAGEDDELIRILGNGSAHGDLNWHRRHRGRSVFDALRSETGLNPLEEFPRRPDAG